MYRILSVQQLVFFFSCMVRHQEHVHSKLAECYCVLCKLPRCPRFVMALCPRDSPAKLGTDWIPAILSQFRAAENQFVRGPASSLG